MIYKLLAFLSYIWSTIINFFLMLRFFKISLLFMLCSNYSLSQTPRLDSMIQLSETMVDDSLKVSTLLTISGDFRQVNANDAVIYAKKALEVSDRIKHKRSKIKSLYMVSAGFITGGIIDSCIIYAKQAEEIATNENQLALLGNIFNLIGAAYRSISDSKNSIEYAYKSVNLLEKINDTLSISYAYQNLGNLYWDKRDTLSAKKFFIKGLIILEDLKDSLNLPNAYSNMYLVTYDDNKKLNYLIRAEEIALKTDNNSDLSYIYTNLGSYYFIGSKNYDKALLYYKKGLFYANRVGDLYSKSQLLSNLGDLFNKKGMQDSSVYYLKNAIEVSKEIDAINELQDEYYTLYDLYKSIGNIDSSFYYLEKYNVIKDSLYNINILSALADANAKYETEKKEAEIAIQKLALELDKKRKNQIIFGSLLALLFLILIYQWYLNKQKRKNRESELALKLKQAETNKLLELNEAKSRFFANITHEFRTPLTLIMGPLKDVIAKIKGDNKNTLKIAESNSKKLLTLVNDILDLSTLEEGSPELNNSKVCLFAWLDRIFSSFESYAKVRQIGTEIIFPDQKDILVDIDIEKFEKVINNILSNAFKYTEAGGNVSMHVDVSKNVVDISIKDTGVGIDKIDIEHVFDRYYQGSNASNITGTGIGLSFANRLAKLMGGVIKVESEKGKGSTFIVHLPIDTQTACPEEIKKNEEDILINENQKSQYEVKSIFDEKPRILVVEDNLEMQKYLLSILQDHFFVDVAENGFKGLEILGKHNYDLVSSDIMMPGMDGFTFRKAMNKIESLKNIPFVLLTARSLKEDKLRGLKLGIDDYITKPFNSDEYIARIINLIQNKNEREKLLNEQFENKLVTNDNADNELIREIERIVLERIDDIEFTVSALAKEIGFSQRKLSNITKKLIGITPVNLILEIRLQKAYQLLKSNRYKTVSEVRYEVGIENASYFSKKFFMRFGIKPGEVNSNS